MAGKSCFLLILFLFILDVYKRQGHTSICYNGPRCACGNYGCLENYCSSIAFTKEVNRVLRPEIEYNFRQVSQLLRDGDQVVTDIFLDACDKLSVGIVNIDVYKRQPQRHYACGCYEGIPE